MCEHVLEELGVLHQVVGVYQNLIAVGSDDQGEAVVLVEMVSRLSCLCRGDRRLASLRIWLSHSVVLRIWSRGKDGIVADDEKRSVLMSSTSGRTLVSHAITSPM